MRALVVIAVWVVASAVNAASLEFSVRFDSVDEEVPDLIGRQNPQELEGRRGTLRVIFDETNLDVLGNGGGALLRLGVPEQIDDFGAFGDIRIQLEIDGVVNEFVTGNVLDPENRPVAIFTFFPGDRLVIVEDDFDGGLQVDVTGVPFVPDPFVNGISTANATGSFFLFEQSGMGVRGTVIPQPVPEPSSFALAGIATLVGGCVLRKRRPA